MVHTTKNAKLRISERIQFFNDVLALSKNNNPAELNIQKPLSELDKSFKLLNHSFKKEEASGHTVDLTALDYRRDQGIICLRKIADAFTNHHLEAKQKAGRLLLKAIDKYGKSISRMNYQAETSVIENLAVDLKKDVDLVAAVKLLGVGDTVDEMKSANDLFNQIYLERIGDDASKDVTPAGLLVRECNEKYKILVKHIEANALINPSEVYTILISELNNLIDRFNALITQRDGKKAKQEEEILS